MRGRRPKATRMKVLTGNPSKRRLNKHEPMPNLAVPDCPPELELRNAIFLATNRHLNGINRPFHIPSLDGECEFMRARHADMMVRVFQRCDQAVHATLIAIDRVKKAVSRDTSFRGQFSEDLLYGFDRGLGINCLERPNCPILDKPVSVGKGENGVGLEMLQVVFSNDLERFHSNEIAGILQCSR